MTATTTGTTAGTLATRRPSLAARIVSLPVHAWRLISRWLPPHCRFYPSCSAYALEALEVHGAVRGTGLAAKRIGRCHPWHPGGLDPVPAPRDRATPPTESNVRSPMPPAARSAETG
jgi:putative membrane protein insertion efficiency factor